MPTDWKLKERESLQLSLLVDMNSPDRVLEEVKAIFLDMFNKGDMTPVTAVYEDTLSLFQGTFPDYKACDTPYHNLRHTTDVFLGMARLIHGAHLAGVRFSETDASLSLIAALMHDTGYIRKKTDRHSSGAMLAPIHVRHSIEFMTRCLTKHSSPNDHIQQTEHIILCTDHDNDSSNVPFASNNLRLLGNMLASADLLAQTADRTYLEKLPLLYLEFRDLGYRNYNSVFDLLKDAANFNDLMHDRLENQLDNVKRYLKNHFKVRWLIDEDLYQRSIDQSMLYLSAIISQPALDYRTHLRRKKGL